MCLKDAVSNFIIYTTLKAVLPVSPDYLKVSKYNNLVSLYFVGG
jgi:hypothetical protein